MRRASGAWLGAVVVLAVATAAAQESRPRRAAVVDPDTVLVGEPFTLGLAIAAPREADVEFPSLLTLDGDVEQLRPPRVHWRAAHGGSWRAHYRLAAWTAGRHTAADVEVRVDGAAFRIPVPTVTVTSVLPAAAEGSLQLEPPRGPWPLRGFPWWLLLLLLALLALWWLLRRLRGRHETQPEGEVIHPATAARDALAALKEDLAYGRVELAAYYDGLEDVLRRYLAATRGWPEERPVRDFVDSRAVTETTHELRSGLRTMRDRAGLVRFAHVAADTPAALTDADVCLSWVDADEEAA